jgi:hypothetical protein
MRQLLVKVEPLCRAQLWYVFRMAPEHPEAFPQQVLIVIQHQTPVAALCKQGREVGAAQAADFHLVHGTLSNTGFVCSSS